MCCPALSFDLEFDGDTILCAASCWTNGIINIPQLWISQDSKGFTSLSAVMVHALLEELWNSYKSGTTIITWGGTGTDWKILLKAAPSKSDMIHELALYSVDIPMVSAAANGMMMGLNSVAMGMGLGSRPSCTSEDVPRLWKSKDASKQHEVVKHVEWDAWACVAIWNRLIFQAQFNRPQLTWMTQKSGIRSVRIQRVFKDTHFSLPSIHDIMQWKSPEVKFTVPDHLNHNKMMEWLKPLN